MRKCIMEERLSMCDVYDSHVSSFQCVSKMVKCHPLCPIYGHGYVYYLDTGRESEIIVERDAVCLTTFAMSKGIRTSKTLYYEDMGITWKENDALTCL